MILCDKSLRKVVGGANPMVIGANPANIQPASIDLSLGGKVFAMKSAALPRNNEKVRDLAKQFKRYDFELDEKRTNVLERGVCYLVELAESLELPNSYLAVTSPKSSTGRSDVFVRVLSDGTPCYDQTVRGYKGPLWAEVTSLSFNVRVSRGLSLTQMRIRGEGDEVLSRTKLSQEQAACGIILSSDGRPLRNNEVVYGNGGIQLHVDLARSIVGFEAVDLSTEELDLSASNAHDPRVFWRPIKQPASGYLVLIPGHFYLLCTRERIRIPSSLVGQVLSTSAASGEFRTHYAGFFDPGFGGEKGTVAVLEVRARDVPFRIVDGQPICVMEFELVDELPERLYDGHYSGKTGPSLSKHFQDRFEVWED